MINRQELEKLAETLIEEVEIESLANINEIESSKNKDIYKQLEDFINKIKNPYCFKCDDIVVKIKFSDTDLSLEEALCNYFVSLKKTGN